MVICTIKKKNVYTFWGTSGLNIHLWCSPRGSGGGSFGPLHGYSSAANEKFCCPDFSSTQSLLCAHSNASYSPFGLIFPHSHLSPAEGGHSSPSLNWSARLQLLSGPSFPSWTNCSKDLRGQGRKEYQSESQNCHSWEQGLVDWGFVEPSVGFFYFPVLLHEADVWTTP